MKGGRQHALADPYRFQSTGTAFKQRLPGSGFSLYFFFYLFLVFAQYFHAFS